MTVLVECKPDEALVRHLGRARRDCVHHDDKGRVCNRLARTEGLVAMIDEDPGSAQPKYLTGLETTSDTDGIRVLRDAARNHRVIVLQPRLEEWVIATARADGVLVSDFGLSERGNELHREINSRLPAFAKLIDALSAAKSKRLARLRELLGA